MLNTNIPLIIRVFYFQPYLLTESFFINHDKPSSELITTVECLLYIRRCYCFLTVTLCRTEVTES